MGHGGVKRGPFSTERLLSTEGGSLYLYNNVYRKRVTSLYRPDGPPTDITAAKFDPSDNNHLAIGLANGKVILRWVNRNKQWLTEGHNDAVTDLAYYKTVKTEGTLFTSGMDSQVICWRVTLPKNQDEDAIIVKLYSFTISPKKQFTYVQIANTSDTNKNVRLLVSQATQLQIWEDKEVVNEWKSPLNVRIMSSCFGAKSECIYAVLSNRMCCIFSPTLTLKSQIELNKSCSVITSHPTLVNQVAVGADDGSIFILELG